MQHGLSIFIITYFVLFFGVVFVWRTYRVWKLTGVNAYRFIAKSGAEGITARYFRIMPILSLLVAVIVIGFPQHYHYLGAMGWLESEGVRYTGVFLMAVSLIWIIVAQKQMGNQWRIGIDNEHDTALVTHGIFSRSRNPIFFGVMVSAAGFFLLLPNAITLVIVGIDSAVIQIQVALEESFLQEKHGDDYAQYCRRVRRWI